MDIWGYYNPFMRPIQVDFVNIRAAGRSPPLPVILRSFAPKNLSDHAPETGGKILRFAQNDKGGGAQNDKGGGARNDKRGKAVILGRASPLCHSEERLSPSLSF